jgi:outer membrane receptor for ferrienterochelin and colicins
VRGDLPEGNDRNRVQRSMTTLVFNPTGFTIRYEQPDACLKLQTMPGIGQIDRASLEEPRDRMTAGRLRNTNRCWPSGNAFLLLLLLLLIGASPIETRGQATGDTNHGQKDLTDLSLEELMNLKVDTVYAASKFQQGVNEAPASITIITSDQIEKNGYRTLSDVLQSVPGFYVTNDRNYSYVGMDGISRPTDYNTHLLIMVDGHRVNDNIFNGAYVGTEALVDVQLIKRIEIIRGPGSSLYGANAFLGVINIVTKRGRDLQGAEVSEDAGSLQTYRERATYGQRYANGLELLLSETYYDSKGNRQLFFPEFNAPATNNGIARNADADQFDSTFLSATFKNFTLHAAYVSREKHIPTASFGTVFDDPRTETTDARAYADLQYQRTLGSGWNLTARGFYDWYQYDGIFIYDYAGTGVPPYTVNHDLERGDWLGFDVSASKEMSEHHRLTVGTEEVFNIKQVLGNYDQTPYFSYLSDHHSSIQSSAYLQDEFAIRDDLLLSAGIRYDQYTTFGGTVNPRLALIFSPHKTADIKILYGQAFRAPDDYELHYSEPSAGFEVSSNLHPETIKTAQVVLEKYFWQHATLSASGYYNWIDQLISQSTDPANGLVHFTNLEGIRSKGMEFQFSDKRPSGWEERLSYTVQESHSSLDGDPLSNSPRHLAKANLIVPWFGKKLFTSFEGQEISRRLTVANTEIGGAFVANATLYSQQLPGRLRLSASLYNLFNKHYADPVGQEFKQPSIMQDGRTFRVQLTWRTK